MVVAIKQNFGLRRMEVFQHKSFILKVFSGSALLTASNLTPSLSLNEVGADVSAQLHDHSTMDMLQRCKHACLCYKPTSEAVEAALIQ